MIIYPPKVIVRNNECILETVFETKGEKKVLWYKTTLEYRDYLVVETSDAALVGLLVLAMKNKEDIHIKGSISSKLYYSLSNYLIKAIALAYADYYSIKIFAESLSEEVFNNSNIAATGLSCGVDSFATIASHKDIMGGYNIKYLTYLNAGSHGVYGGELANTIYKKRLLKVREFANSINTPLVIVESNIMDVIKVNFQSLHTLIHLSCILNLQKLIRTYFYASSFRFDFYNIYGINSSWDILILSLLETESINFYSSASQFTRYERVELIANYEPSYNFLDVCTAAQNSIKINCSKCEKCIRTQLTLELIGKLDKYKEVFDFNIYKKYRDQFISDLILVKNKNQTNKDLFLALKQKKQIKLKHYLLVITLLIKRRLYKFKRKLVL